MVVTTNLKHEGVTSGKQEFQTSHVGQSLVMFKTPWPGAYFTTKRTYEMPIYKSVGFIDVQYYNNLFEYAFVWYVWSLISCLLQ